MADRRQVDKYETNAVKQAVDESILNFLESKENLEADNTTSNYRIILGSIICIAAAVSHFFPIPFPKNVPLLIACVSVYAICSAILQYIASKIERDAIFIGDGLRVSTWLPKYDDQFTITAQLEGGTGSATITKSIGNWFDEEGYLHDDVLHKDVKSLLKEIKFSSKKTN
eukprot:TRINITY_DN284_c0_g5_i1.p1 TRINITY_DN284_c0_g5~~TRINITY_DN284_c0_g5_i1.p1  ORF type:complete len:184 (+),score=51.00 TRINITY_DN284_c0_g5_i1:43-552(+)